MRLRFILMFLWAALCNAVAQSGCISVVVLDHKGGPLAKMHVRVTRPASSQWWIKDTDDKGQVQFTALPPGIYTVFSQNEDLGYPVTYAYDFTGIAHLPEYTLTDSPQCQEITMQREPPAGRLRLKLTDQNTGDFIEEPQAQFHITIDGVHNRQGAIWKNHADFLVPSLKPFELWAEAKGYKTAGPFIIKPFQPGEVRDFATVLKAFGLGCLKGKVLDVKGQPVVGIRVNFFFQSDPSAGTARDAVTDKDGKFEVHDLPSGHYTVSAFSMELGYDPSSMVTQGRNFPNADVPASANCGEVTVNLKEPNGKFSADVVDAETHLPLKRFRFRVTCPALPRWWAEGRDFVREVQVPTKTPCNVKAEWDGYVASEPLALEPFQPSESRKMTIQLRPVHAGEGKSQ